MFGQLLAASGVTGGTEAARLFVSVGADVNKALTGLGMVDAKTKQTQSTLGGLPKAAKLAAIGLAGGLVLSAAAAISFESAYAGVKKTVDETDLRAAGMSFESLEADIRGMAKTMPIAANDLAHIAEQAGALGVKAADIKEFTRVAALIGVTTDVSSDQAATALGQLSNVLGLTAKDYERFGSTLVDLGNKGASTESQILEITSRAGAAAHLIGLSSAATLGWSSAIANLGIEVEAGGSALQKFFLDAARQTAAGGEKLKVWASTAGVSAEQFKQAMEKDAGGALQTFIVGLGKMDRASQLAVLSALGFKDVRISRAILGLAGNTDNLTNSLKTADAAWQSNTAMATEAQKRFETTASKIAVMWNNVVDLGISIGQLLLPAIGFLADGLGFVASMLAKIPGPVWLGIATAITVALVPAVVSATVAFGALTIAALPWIALFAAIGAAVALLAAAWQSNFLGMQQVVESIIRGIGSNLARFVGFFMEAAEIIVGVAASIPGPWQDGAKDIAKALDEAHAAVDRWRDGVKLASEDTVHLAQTGMGAMGIAAHKGAVDVAAEAPNMTAAAKKLMAGMPGEVDKGAKVIIGKFGQIPEKGADAMLDAQWHLKDATKQLVDFMDHALSPAREKANLRGFLASKALARGLASNNPLIREKAEEMRDAALRRLALLRHDGERSGKALVEGVAWGLSTYSYIATGKAKELTEAIAGYLPHSEPKNPASGLRGITTVGEKIVRSITDGMARSLHHADHAGKMLSSALSPGMTFGLMMTGARPGPGFKGAVPGTRFRSPDEGGVPVVIPVILDGREVGRIVDRNLYYRRPRASVLPR